ncbi:bifunctional folylpolyglutamate synthase and dihydrofolate synthase [Georgfuchsia toluolica]|uniref:Dihydrofolate synthase/folylpolyglutamate synthase n=1 Tax=Georgfuchsia toluolica TaxID=424218 RepID=A0A916J3R7_9PROT|nr:bifunctional tetrahydrofolate synthase/dihydrofolate synthase [Georgfuchsia toluolica]CAG4883443.1 bifunctional folylpolyglutamate synthase and dihydrofolate synthase [Georgfuchsia toluolica]
MPDSLSGWLAYIECQHVRPIVLDLERVEEVRSTLGQTKNCVVITVGGTNGKGSVCAILESILLRAGYRIGLYTSPHFLDYNERVRVNGRTVSDDELCRGFTEVEAVRNGTLLTYFEFGTLAAWQVFVRNQLDVIILEVGLGGRLDAVNVYEPDCAVVTTVDLDHMDYLGSDREQIGFEKAGIFRHGKPAICGDSNPPSTLLAHAATIGADLRLIGHDYGFVSEEQQWQFWSWLGKRSGLALPALRGGIQLTNASTALAALDTLGDLLPVATQDVQRGLMEVELPGRFQIIPGKPAVVLDVAHNPQAAGVLAENLGNMASARAQTWAVFGMMADKDIAGVIRAVKPWVTHWLVCTLPGSRAANAAQLAELLRHEGVTEPIGEYPSAAEAFAYARGAAEDNDKILVFGSFLTVADVMRILASGA